MTDRTDHARLRTAFDALLLELDGSWPREALDDLREDLAHAEFGEALENLVALAMREGHPLDSSARRQVEHLAASIGLENSPHVARWRASAVRRPPPSPG